MLSPTLPQLCRFCIRLCQGCQRFLCRTLSYNLCMSRAEEEPLFDRINPNLLTVVLNGKAQRRACLDGEGSRKTIKNLRPMALRMRTGRGPVFVMGDAIEIEMNPLHKSRRDAVLGCRYVEDAVFHREQFGSQVEP